jgi:hypothetical protein
MPVTNPARGRAGTAGGGGWHSRSSYDVTACQWLPASEAIRVSILQAPAWTLVSSPIVSFSK